LGFREQNVAPLESRLREQNVVPSELILGEKKVAPLELRIDESSNLCGLKLTMVMIYNSNDKITPNPNWEFQLKNGGLYCLKTYIH
jgi:hypothetical protein